MKERIKHGQDNEVVKNPYEHRSDDESENKLHLFLVLLFRFRFRFLRHIIE